MEPVIQYNSSTGSAFASGAGPATAVSGTCTTGGTSVTSISVFLGNLADVATDGSHTIYFTSPQNGKQIYKITGVDTKTNTITIEDTAGIGGTGVGFIIGGKRSGLEDSSVDDYSAFKEGWTAEFDSGTYDVTGTWTVPLSTTNGPGFTIRAASGQVTKPIIRQNNTAGAFPMIVLGHRTVIKDLRFVNNSISSSTSNNIFRNNDFVIGIVVKNCEMICTRTSGSNGGYGMRASNSVGLSGIFLDCYWEGGRYAMYYAGGRCNTSFVNNRFTGWFYGVRSSVAGNNGTLIVDHCIFDNNASIALWIGVQNTWSNHIRNCTFYNNGNNAIQWDGNNSRSVEVTHCIFLDNDDWALRDAGSGGSYQFEDYNFFWNNTSGNISNTDVISGGNSQVANPLLKNPASADFTPSKDSPVLNIDNYGKFSGAVGPDTDDFGPTNARVVGFRK